MRRYGLFLTTGEGKEMPNGEEEASGYVVDSEGRTYRYWLGWDRSRHEPAFTRWDQTQPKTDWLDDGEYLQALKDAGCRRRTGRR